MTRPLLEETAIHPAIRTRIASHHRDLIEQVQATLRQHACVVVGMAGNPFVSRARKALGAAGLDHGYVEVGSYFSQWRRRNVLKMWTGWPTFPMVFVRGTLIGGADDLRRLIDSGELQKLLAA